VMSRVDQRARHALPHVLVAVSQEHLQHGVHLVLDSAASVGPTRRPGARVSRPARRWPPDRPGARSR
jgi:hypothetical protein